MREMASIAFYSLKPAFITSLIAKFFRQLLVWRSRPRLPVAKDWATVPLATGAIACLVIAVRQLGGLQPLELAAFDLMVRMRPDPGPDPRLFVVEITQTDIQSQNHWPLSDRVLAQLLQKLAEMQPTAIGLDVLRSVPIEPGNAELAAQLKNPKLLAITYIGSSDEETVPPPRSVPKERIGFNNLILDPDGLIRRNLMYASSGTVALRSFAFELALAYLQRDGIQRRVTKDGEYQVGNAVFAKLQANSGGYQTIDARGYQILLNYRSPRNVARTVTLTEVLEGKIDANWVKDKIVLIGVTAPSIKDRFYTPYSATETGKRTMPGVLIHAQMVSQILSAVKGDRPLFWYWDEWAELLWIVVWAAIGSVLAWRIDNPLFLWLSSTGMLGVLCSFGFVLFLQGGWIPIFAPAASSAIAGSFVVAYRLQQARQQQGMVMKLLGQQTSPEIADALWKNRDRLLQAGLLPGQRLTATMLLTDLKGFSTLSEQKPPEVVMAWLNEYLAVMTELVQNYQGVINKFTGDGMLAVFGVPVARESKEEIAKDARRAVACALAMGDRLAELNQGWKRRGLPEVQMRVGIFTGPIMVGSLGGKDRLEYGVIGDSVNIAARLESCEKDSQPCLCRILIAKETLIHIQEQFQVESWGSMQLRGREQEVDVYRVIGRVPDTHSA